MRFLRLAICLLVSCVLLVACNKDNDSGGNSGNENENGKTNTMINRVFVGKKPLSAGDIKSIELDKEGRASLMKLENKEMVKFDYSKKNVVLMNVYDDGSLEYALEMTIGKNGFVESVVEQDDGETKYWRFKYNSDGQLCYMWRSESERETNITYKNGDIVKVQTIDTDETEGERWEHITAINYTSKEYATSIENKGCVMLFDDAFDIDMDEMCYAYYAGLLGKSTKHLPLENDDISYNIIYPICWTLDSDGYPISVNVYSDDIMFKWL